MQPFLADFFERHYYNQTFLHPLAAVAVLVMAAMVFTLPRKTAFLPFLVLVCFISSAQRISVGGLDFNLLRILVICAGIRLFTRGEMKDLKWMGMDTLVVAWGIVEATAYLTLRDWSSSAFVFQAGQKFESLGLYFVVRGLIRTWEDAKQLCSIFALICIPVAIAFAIEYSTGRNWFSIFGGVPAITYVREGRMRCNGAFPHPILSGGFFAALAPLAAARYWSRDKTLGLYGAMGALFVVFTSSSSTSWGAGMAGVGAGLLYPLRYKMRNIRWTCFLTLVALHMYMTMPVWHLLARIDLVGGSTGWHRYNLINQCVERWREWALFGVLSTRNWGIQLFDVTNQYVLVAVNGGMGALILYVGTIVAGFRYAGRMVRATEGNKELSAISWAMGVALWVHCVNFIGVSYFGQMQFCWYLVLGVLCSLGEAVARAPVEALAGERLQAVPDRTPRIQRNGGLRPMPRRPGRRAVLRPAR